ncbi:MAG TPA: rod shape-determining protein MreC [Firmicutes bacterium]|nr:rod shape-determining protein MreC [Bacillota bacterium]
MANRHSKGYRRFYFLLAIVLGLLLLISYTGSREDFTPLEDAVRTLFAPVQKVFAKAGTKIQYFFDTVAQFQQVKAENESLKKEITLLESQLLYLQELQKENHRYRELLEFKYNSGFELLPAEVIARDPSQWFGTITINQGYLDGVQQEMAVITSQGLVGMISSVSPHSSQVILLTDPRLAVSAIVQRSREAGVVGIVESYPKSPAYLRLTNLPLEANILPGDQVVSSGMGGIFPKGLYIGKVKEVGEDQFGLVLSAVIEPKVNFNRLEEVLIVLGGSGNQETVVESEIEGAGEDTGSPGETG